MSDKPKPTQELIPIDFDKLKVGDEVVCRGGHPAVVIWIGKKSNSGYPISCVTNPNTESEDIIHVGKDGFEYGSNTSSIDDIFQKPKPKKKLWIALENKAERGEYYLSSHFAFPTKERLEQYITDEILKKSKIIEIEVGE